MLCIMHSAEPYGHLRIGDCALDEASLARYLGVPQRTIATLLRDLEDVGAFSRTPEGVIYSRRMVRDEAVREARAAGGSKSLEHPRVPRRKDPPDGPMQGRVQGYPSDGPWGGPLHLQSSSSGTLPSGSAVARSWRDELDLEFEAIRKLEIQALSPSQRVTLGRYHAWRFANCSASEAKNRRAGAKIAGSFATMATVFELSDLSVDEYVLVAERYFAASGGAPWFTPFDVKAMLPREILERRNGVARR